MQLSGIFTGPVMLSPFSSRHGFTVGGFTMHGTLSLGSHNPFMIKFSQKAEFNFFIQHTRNSVETERFGAVENCRTKSFTNTVSELTTFKISLNRNLIKVETVNNLEIFTLRLILTAIVAVELTGQAAVQRSPITHPCCDWLKLLPFSQGVVTAPTSPSHTK